MLTPQALEFVTDRHVATLATLGPDGHPHVVPIGFTFVDGIARIITSGGNQKVRNIERTGYATLCQFEGARWITLAGPATIERDAASVAHAVELYTARYRPARENPLRVAIHIQVERVLGSSGMRA